MGSSEGEAIAAPDVGGTGGSRAQHGGDAGSAVRTPLACCRNNKASNISDSSSSSSSSSNRSISRNSGRTGQKCTRRERQLESVCLIGQGSDALVYLVRCKSTGAMSALKVQRKADHARSAERVQMEREVMVDARHPLVAPLYSAFQDQLYLYLGMEYCPGGSLDNFVRHGVRRNLTEDEARFYAAEITLGLEFLHSKGYVYRDLKAANVLVAGSGHIKLTDFGIAERGKVKVETDDKMWQDCSLPRPLPRTKSSPVFVRASATKSTPSIPPAVRSPQEQSLGQKNATVPKIQLSPEHHAGKKMPPRAEALTRRASASDCCITDTEKSALRRAAPYEFPPSSSLVSLKDNCKASTDSRTGARDASKLFRRMKSQQEQRQTAPAPSLAGPATLAVRMREKFLRSPLLGDGAPGGSVSFSTLSALPETSTTEVSTAAPVIAPGSESDVSVYTGATTPATPQEGSSLPGIRPSPHGRRCPSVLSRDGGRKHGAASKRERGLPPLDLTDASLRDSSGSPSSSCRGRRAQQTTVTLDEASWNLLSGSPEYMAPEVLMHDPQGSAVDWWGLGILTFELLLGSTPFVGKNGKTRFTYLNIMNKEAQFPGPGEREVGDVSEACQDFIRALLAKDPRERAGSRGAQAVKAHRFFSSVSWKQLLKQAPPFLPLVQCGVRPPVVENTSGWWWDVEEAIAVEAKGEAEEREAVAPGITNGDGTEGRCGWWPFDRFDWTDDEDERDRNCSTGSE